MFHVLLGVLTYIMDYNILYIGNFTERESPLGYCPNAMWITETLRSLGHTVTAINEHDADADADAILQETYRQKYDFILTEEGRLRGDFVNDLERGEDIVLGLFSRVLDETKIPIVAWLSNIFYGIMRRELQIKTNPIFRSDIVFSTDGGHDKEFRDAGVNHVNLRMGIYEPEAYLGKPIYPTANTVQVAFIGSIYEEIWPYRKELVDWLGLTYKNKFMHVGARGEVRHDDLNNFVATVKVIVGDSVYSPNYWSNRIYEVIGRGGFIIHPMVEGLEKEFTPYEHFVPYTFGDLKGLKEKIDYYMTHDEERERIRLAGFEHCKKHHTYKHRVQKMLDILKEQEII